jgi:ElaB/YqjD/DUF883 family membrane-anchored ribosome-binding protein
MGEDPDAIRDEIADTRERMGDKIDALGYKADVKSRAKDNVSGKVDAVKGQVRGAASVAQENPLGLAVGAAAVGFLAGLLVPSSRVEDEKLGPMADRVKDQAKETGQEALERGKQVAQSAADTAGEEGQKQGERLADSAKQSAGSLRS